MKHKSKFIPLLLIPVIMLGACGNNPLDLFKLKSVKIAEVSDSGGAKTEEELLKEAEEYEKEINSQVNAGAKLGSVYESLGIKYAEKKSWEQSASNLEKALANGSDSGKVHFYLAASYANIAMNTNNSSYFEKAVFHYKKAIEKNPSDNDALYGLALTEFYGSGNREKGISAMKQAAESDERNMSARFALARMYYETGNTAEALSLYESIYAYAQNMPSSQQKDDYIKNAKSNIDRITSSFSGSAK